MSDSVTSIYPVFTPGANDDEFNDESFSGWTAVNSGSQVPTVTEINHVASILHPGGGGAQNLWAYMKSYSPSANDYIEIAFKVGGNNQAYNRAGLIMADGVSFSSGTQAVFFLSFFEAYTILTTYNGYNTDNAGFLGSSIFAITGGSVIFLRLKYEGSNHFRGYISPDGVSWMDATGQQTVTVTPTNIGFFLTPHSGSLPVIMSVHYFKQSA